MMIAIADRGLDPDAEEAAAGCEEEVEVRV